MNGRGNMPQLKRVILGYPNCDLNAKNCGLEPTFYQVKVALAFPFSLKSPTMVGSLEALKWVMQAKIYKTETVTWARNWNWFEINCITMLGVIWVMWADGELHRRPGQAHKKPAKVPCLLRSGIFVKRLFWFCSRYYSTLYSYLIRLFLGVFVIGVNFFCSFSLLDFNFNFISETILL